MIRHESRTRAPMGVALIDTAELAVLLDRSDRASRERLAVLLADAPRSKATRQPVPQSPEPPQALPHGSARTAD